MASGNGACTVTNEDGPGSAYSACVETEGEK